MQKLYISDLDGTLLQNDGTLSRFSYNNLQRLLRAGVQFIFATARSVKSVESIFAGIEFPLPVIEFNGCYLTDFNTGEHIIINAIRTGICTLLLNHIIRQGYYPTVSTYHDRKDRLYYSKLTNEGIRQYVCYKKQVADPRLSYIERLEDTLKECVVNISVIDTRERIVQLKDSLAAFKDELTVILMENQYTPGWYWLMIQDCGATKEQAILDLMQKYGIDPGALTVFGDNCNDLGMFSIAKQRIAVSNALPEIKARATRVIGTNQEDSVIKYIMADYL